MSLIAWMSATFSRNSTENVNIRKLYSFMFVIFTSITFNAIITVVEFKYFIQPFIFLHSFTNILFIHNI